LIAPDPKRAQQEIRVTHPFHPLAGRQFSLVVRKNNWAEDRVFFFADDGQLTSLPSCWTDVDPPDPFDAVSAGRSPFRVEDLLALAALIDGMRSASRQEM
jgi:Family of unknown function (DUF5372)